MAALFVPTGRLSNVIQMITLSRQSGILRAIRGQDSARQMGQIRFVNGQPASVLFGQMVGEHALNALMGWGECMYSFDEFTSDEAEGDGYYSSSDGGQYGAYGNYSNPPSPPTTGSWPSYGYPPSNPNYSQSSPSQYPPNPASSPYPPSYGGGYSQPAPTHGNTGYSGNQGYPGSTGYQGGAPDANDPYYRQTTPQQQGFTATSMPGAPSFRAEMLEAVPYQTGMSEPIEQLPLDRRERMILLLVNGQRSMLDLVRLTHRSDREIYSVLHHLALLGLIQFRR